MEQGMLGCVQKAHLLRVLSLYLATIVLTISSVSVLVQDDEKVQSPSTILVLF